MVNAPRAVSDSEGRYRLEGLALGAQSIAVAAAGSPQGVKDVDISAGENHLDLHLGAGYAIDGRVVDGAGAGVPGAEVQSRGEGGYSRATSGADGAFHLAGVSPGPNRITAELAGHSQAAPQTVTVADASVSGVVVKLARAGTIAGKIVGLTAPDLARVEVKASRENGVVFGDVDFQGAYRIAGVGAGEWLVFAQVGSRVAHGKVTLAEGSDGTLDLQFAVDGLVLSGHVTRGGEPVIGAIVAVLSQDGTSANGKTDATGAFRLEGLKPGTYGLYLVELETGTMRNESVELTADRDVAFDLANQRVAGRVIDASDGSAAAGASVRLDLVSGPFAGSGLSPAATTDAAGRFSFAGLGPGDYRAQARKDGYASAAVPVQLAAGADVDDVRIELQPAHGITLQLTGPAASTLGAVGVAWLAADGALVSSGRYAVGEGGRVRVPDVPAGTFRLRGGGGDVATASVDVTVPGDTAPVLLLPGATLVVHAPLPPGSPPAVFTLTGADGRPFRDLDAAGGLQQQWPLPVGGEVRGLPAGSWTVTVTAGTVTLHGQATTTAGGTVEVTLR
ncbi:MAG TPA: carboxypeptidase regulatory-like domain-containing protein [Thermoanaerobaculia bacterium]